MIAMIGDSEKAASFVARLLANPAMDDLTHLQKEEQVLLFLNQNQSRLVPVVPMRDDSKAMALFERVVVVAILLILVQTLVEDLAVLLVFPSAVRDGLAMSGFAFDLFFALEFFVRVFRAMIRGLSEPGYMLEAQVDEHYAPDEVYVLASHYNSEFLPMKARTESAGEASGSIRLDDYEDILKGGG